MRSKLKKNIKVLSISWFNNTRWSESRKSNGSTGLQAASSEFVFGGRWGEEMRFAKSRVEGSCKCHIYIYSFQNFAQHLNAFQRFVFTFRGLEDRRLCRFFNVKASGSQNQSVKVHPILRLGREIFSRFKMAAMSDPISVQFHHRRKFTAK